MKHLERVTKANKLIELSHRLDVQEQRLLASLVSRISPTDEDFVTYKFTIAELSKMTEPTRQPDKVRAKQLVRKMQRQGFEILTDDGWESFAWFSFLKYRQGEQTIEIEFSPKLRPYLLKLKEHFTTYRLENVLKLRSKYSFRMYELLRSHLYQGTWTVTLEHLRKVLGLETLHSQWRDFKKNVLNVAQKELTNKTDLYFEYETRRRNKFIAVLIFTIHTIDKKPRIIGDNRLQGKAARCYAEKRGACSVTWEMKQDRETETCYWCEKFTSQRLESAGQGRLPGME